MILPSLGIFLFTLLICWQVLPRLAATLLDGSGAIGCWFFMAVPTFLTGLIVSLVVALS